MPGPVVARGAVHERQPRPLAHANVGARDVGSSTPRARREATTGACSVYSAARRGSSRHPGGPKRPWSPQSPRPYGNEARTCAGAHTAAEASASRHADELPGHCERELRETRTTSERTRPPGGWGRVRSITTLRRIRSSGYRSVVSSRVPPPGRRSRSPAGRPTRSALSWSAPAPVTARSPRSRAGASGELGLAQTHSSMDMVAACADCPTGSPRRSGKSRRSSVPCCWCASRSSPTRSGARARPG